MPANTKFKCDHCGHSGRDSGSSPFEKVSFVELPELLVICLVRWGAYDVATLSAPKLSHRVDIPEMLPLRGQLYKLRGVVNHGGATPSAGHYWAYVSTSDGSWVECNDKSIVIATQAEPWQADQSHLGCDDPVPYVMFYERVESSGSASSQGAVSG